MKRLLDHELYSNQALFEQDTTSLKRRRPEPCQGHWASVPAPAEPFHAVGLAYGSIPAYPKSQDGHPCVGSGFASGLSHYRSFDSLRSQDSLEPIQPYAPGFACLPSSANIVTSAAGYHHPHGAPSASSGYSLSGPLTPSSPDAMDIEMETSPVVPQPQPQPQPRAAQPVAHHPSVYQPPKILSTHDLHPLSWRQRMNS